MFISCDTLDDVLLDLYPALLERSKGTVIATSPDFSRCLVEGCGGLTSVVVEQGQSFGHGFLARCGELAGIIRRIMKLGCFPCGPGVQMAALSSAAHAVRKTSV